MLSTLSAWKQAGDMDFWGHCFKPNTSNVELPQRILQSAGQPTGQFCIRVFRSLMPPCSCYQHTVHEGLTYTECKLVTRKI